MVSCEGEYITVIIKFLEQFLEQKRPSSRQRLWLQNELDNVGVG